LLPTILGVGLAPFTGGLSAALLVGGGYAAATGSLKKGLMAGLGAYGGAGLGQSLASVGASALPGATAANLGAQGSAFGTSLAASGQPVAGSIASGVAPAAAAPVANVANVANAATTGGVQIGEAIPTGNAFSQFDRFKPFTNPAYGAYGQAPVAPVVTAPPPVVTAPPPAQVEAVEAVQPAPQVQGKSDLLPDNWETNEEILKRTGFDGGTSTTGAQPPSYFDNLKAGFGEVTSDSGKAWEFAKANKGALAGVGFNALQAMQASAPKGKKDKSMIRPYTLERVQNQDAYASGINAQGQTNTPTYGQPFDSSERNYFTDTYTALDPYEAPGPEYKAASGGLMSFAVGGPIEEMAAQNSTSGNSMYPQANLHTPMYSDSQMQRPMSNSVVSLAGDAAVDPYTGEQKFAKGGDTSATQDYSFNPQTQQFTRLNAATPVPNRTSSGGFMGIGGGGYYGTPNAPVDPRHFMGKFLSQHINQSNATAQPTVSGGIAAAQMNQAPRPAPQYANYRQSSQGQQTQQPDNMSDFYDYMQAQMGDMQGQGYAGGGMAHGDSHLGGYSDGGRLLKGPGDGVSDSIPAVIGKRQPARLADGEFVIPARIVSELGNGSTDAGARKLYAMMDRVQRARKKTTGKNQVAKNTRSNKLLPA
jgi:hypothetical protein